MVNVVKNGLSDSPSAERKSRDEKAAALIINVISDSYIDDVGHFEHAREVWDALSDRHANIGTYNSLLVFRECVLMESQIV